MYALFYCIMFRTSECKLRYSVAFSKTAGLALTLFLLSSGITVLRIQHTKIIETCLSNLRRKKAQIILVIHILGSTAVGLFWGTYFFVWFLFETIYFRNSANCGLAPALLELVCFSTFLGILSAIICIGFIDPPFLILHLCHERITDFGKNHVLRWTKELSVDKELVAPYSYIVNSNQEIANFFEKPFGVIFISGLVAILLMGMTVLTSGFLAYLVPIIFIGFVLAALLLVMSLISNECYDITRKVAILRGDTFDVSIRNDFDSFLIYLQTRNPTWTFFFSITSGFVATVFTTAVTLLTLSTPIFFTFFDRCFCEVSSPLLICNYVFNSTFYT